MGGTWPHWLGGAVTLLLLAKLAFYAAVVVAILKVFEISREIKEIRRSVGSAPRPAPPQA